MLMSRAISYSLLGQWAGRNHVRQLSLMLISA